jgi:hypothetical protein
MLQAGKGLALCVGEAGLALVLRSLNGGTLGRNNATFPENSEMLQSQFPWFRCLDSGSDLEFMWGSWFAYVGHCE